MRVRWAPQRTILTRTSYHFVVHEKLDFHQVRRTEPSGQVNFTKCDFAGTTTLSCGGLTSHFDFKHGRPLLSRNKQVIILDVVRYTVEHRFVIDPFASRKQPSKIDPRDHMPVFRRYTRNPIGVPDVSVDIALDISSSLSWSISFCPSLTTM
jgi:hypothetical protein